MTQHFPRDPRLRWSLGNCETGTRSDALKTRDHRDSFEFPPFQEHRRPFGAALEMTGCGGELQGLGTDLPTPWTPTPWQT